MSRSFKQILSLTLSIILVLGLVAGGLAIPASASTTTYQLVDLLAEGKIKPLGRTQANAAGTGITAEWSGTGFDIKVSGNGGTMTLGYSSNYSSYVAVLVDDAQIWRGQLASGTGSQAITIPAGSHTVRVVKETQISSSSTGYWNFTTLGFAGTIENAPGNKSPYIEFIGDSYTCGDGALGKYEPGVKWLSSHDSATNGFAYYTAQKLGADYSLVARGGIGLFTGASAQEGTTQKAGMQDVYNYVSGYNKGNGQYSFSRQPDVVVIALGANDSTNTTEKLDRWDELINTFVDQVRAKNPNAEIVLHSTDAGKYKRLMDLVESRKSSDPKLHTFFYAFLGNGSAALETQYAGHPSADDHMHFAEALANFIRSEDLIPTVISAPSYTDITYYISESGSDSNAGTSADAPVLTLAKAVELANTGSYNEGERIVFSVSGAVTATTAQTLGGIQAAVPVCITSTIPDARASLKLVGNASIYSADDITFQNVQLVACDTAAAPLAACQFYAAGNKVTFDNVVFAAGTNWQVSADHYASAEAPVESSVTFKNGNYTNLSRVCVISNNTIGENTTAPGVTAKLIIEDGAQMGTVYNRYGTLTVANAQVIINGGSVQQYVGTANGTSSSARRAYTGNINLTVTGGHIYGTHFSTAGNFAAIAGNINTTISGGIFSITPRNNNQYDAYFFGGRQNCTVQNINTTISGGQFYLLFDVANVDASYYFGVAGNGRAANVTNKISGGLFMPIARNATGKDADIYFGPHMGYITGTLRNEISGGNFILNNSKLTPHFHFGSRGVNWSIGKMVNIIGTNGSTHGPVFSGGDVLLGGTWAQLGVTARSTTGIPALTECSDEVVLSNTIYGGQFTTVHLATSWATQANNGYFSFIKGSVKSDIYGGFFGGSVYGAGNCEVFGHVTTNIYGGHFRSVYGGQQDKALAFDGVELNIYGMDEFFPVNPSNSWVIRAGNASGSVPVPQTPGRDAIKLTVAPEQTTGLTLNTPLQVGSTSGTVSVTVSGGKFPRGFAVAGVTVKNALASGVVPMKDADKSMITVTEDMTSTGTDPVTLIYTAWTTDNTSITLSDTTVTYDGVTDAKVPTVTVKFNDVALVKGTDYNVSYQRDGQNTTDLNTPGIVTVIATAKAPYSGTLQTSYTINLATTVTDAIEDVTNRAGDFDASTVKSTDEEALAALKADISAILQTNAKALSDAQKQALNALLADVNAMEETITTVAKQLADVKSALAAYENDAVTMDDAEKLSALSAALNTISDGNLTETEKAEKKAAAQRIADLQKIIADNEEDLKAADAVQKLMEKLPETAEPDDEAAIAALKAAKDAYEALSDIQKALVSKAALTRAEQLSKALVNYRIITGDQSTWVKESGKDLTVTANGLLSKLTAVKVDGKTVDTANYTTASGSTIVTFKAAYLQTLSEGKHTVTLSYPDGEATGSFTVSPKPTNPETSDNTDPALLSLLAVSALAAAAAVTIAKKRRVG